MLLGLLRATERQAGRGGPSDKRGTLSRCSPRGGDVVFVEHGRYVPGGACRRTKVELAAFSGWRGGEIVVPLNIC